MESAKPSILFVDDEKSVLDGLYRSFSLMHDNWTLLFAGSGAEALEIVGHRTVDVVVTDLRMPGMDGAELLEKIRTISPETTRIILSGCSEREVAYRTIGPAHQHYAKPCSNARLAEAVRRALAVRGRLRAPQLLAIVSGAKSLPALPTALIDLLDEVQSPTGSAAAAARIIGSDVGLTAQLLKLANSGFFGFAAPINNVSHAVRLLGFETIRALLVLGGVFETFARSGIDLEVVRRLQARSLVIGQVARRIAASEALDQTAVEQSQCAGMLAHVGSLVLFTALTGQVGDAYSHLERSGGTISDVERTYLGVTHADCGASLLDLWGFPSAVVEAVLFHHEPVRCGSGVSPLTAVHAAQHLVRPAKAGRDKAEWWAAGLDMDYLRRIAVEDHVDGWAGIAEATIRGRRT